ncbi:hypothetical protein [Streptococcus ferus]
MTKGDQLRQKELELSEQLEDSEVEPNSCIAILNGIPVMLSF